jgi:hypothetical protein
MMGRTHPELSKKRELLLFLGQLLGHDECFIQVMLTAVRYLTVSCAICVRKLPTVEVLALNNLAP